MKRSAILLVLILAGIIIGLGVLNKEYIINLFGVKNGDGPQQTERKVLFYRHPMNPNATSPTPKKDEMGMDYIPVYEEAGVSEELPGTVVISPEKIQKTGVKSEEVIKRTLKRTIRTVGRVDHDEARVYDINTKVSGWMEKLYVNKTDQMVHPGEKLD